MSLLKSESNRKDYVLVGTHVSSRVHNYLTLYSLAKSTTKAKIISKLIVNWMEENKDINSQSELIKEIIQNINIRWKINKSHGVCNFDDYKKAVELELSEKGIKQTYIVLILSEIKQ